MKPPSPLPQHLVDLIARTNAAAEKIAAERARMPSATLRRAAGRNRPISTSGAVAALRRVRSGAKSAKANNAAVAALKSSRRLKLKDRVPPSVVKPGSLWTAKVESSKRSQARR
jgi:hypothetical protein